MAKSTLRDIGTLIQAGINPANGLPIRFEGKGEYKASVKKAIRILDEQNAVNRYTWYNLPCNITSQELERMLYYKGQLCFFYFPEIDSFFFMPYALDGTIDFYGRFNTVHPVPMTSGQEGSKLSKEEQDQYAKQRVLLSTLKLKVLYDIPLDEEVDISKSCVLLHDYTKQLSQTIVPRQMIQEGIIDIMSDCIPFMRTALLRSTGIQAMRVQNQDEASNVFAVNDSLEDAALKGKIHIPVIGSIDFQELTGGEVGKAEEFMMAEQSLDNFRLSLLGLDNGGLFQKKSHMLEAEQEMNAGNINVILQDGLSIRQHFCDVVNGIWGLGISCEISEPVIDADLNGDGIIAEEQDQSGTMQGEQDSMEVADE